MTHDNQLQLYKRLLCWKAENTPSVNMNEVNQMIADANRAAYDSLDDCDKVHVREAVETLKANTKAMGFAGGLEVLSAIAQVLHERP